MSEEPQAEEAPKEAPKDTPAEESAEADVEATEEAPAAPGPDVSFTLRALIVAAVTFVVVLAMVIGIYVFNVSGKAGPAKTDPEDATEKQAPASAEFAYVKLLEKNAARTVIGPQGDRSITCIYTITVKVPANRVEVVQKLVDPAGDNMLAAVKEKVRRIITRTGYLKLRSENLDGAKQQIVQELNLLLRDDIVKDVVFEDWSVTQ